MTPNPEAPEPQNFMVPEPTDEATGVTGGDGWRWCLGGPPDDTQPEFLRRTVALLEGSRIPFVVCACPVPWRCKDPDTIPRGRRVEARQARHERVAAKAEPGPLESLPPQFLDRV